MIGTFLCYDDHIIALGEMGLVESVKFSYEPFDSVSRDGIPCPFTYGDPQSRHAQPVAQTKDREMGRVISFAQSIYIDKVLSIQ
jgi:hypothetical protein